MCVCLLYLSAAIGTSSAAAVAAQGDLSTTGASLLEQFCFECHGELGAEAKVNLQQMAVDPDFAGRFKTWERVVTMLRQRKMPPEDMPQPSDAEREKLIALIRAQLDNFMRRHAGDPGHVVLRRLTSAEYAYAIQDLTGLNLPLDRMFVSDAVGGEGFTNVGDVQFMQDSTLQRYLEAAKLVASHAVIGSGPLDFYPDPRQTGLELSAIHRIQAIYRAHGFRTSAGEGAESFGLHRYPKAFFVAWQFQYRNELGLGNVTLAKLARGEQLSVRFVEHLWDVFNEPAFTFPTSEIARAWRALPVPEGNDAALAEEVRSKCDKIYTQLRDWQSTLAQAAGDEEEAAVLTDGVIQVSPKHVLKADLQWPQGAPTATAELSVAPASDKTREGSVVLWRNPRVRFRRTDQTLSQEQPLQTLLSAESIRRLAFGRHPNGGEIGPHDFVLSAGTTVSIELQVPDAVRVAQLLVDVELDFMYGEDGIVRCSITDGEVEGETAAETGDTSVLLANPNGEGLAAWKEAVRAFARKLPEVSHREPAPSDRDPIPAPFDNGYNTTQRNLFHYRIKYHRDDAFLVEHVLDDATRTRLDQAWNDLLTSFEYHDDFLRFVAEAFGLELKGQGITDFDQQQIDRLPAEPRAFVQALHDGYEAATRALKAAQPGHVSDALALAELAWRRPLAEQEKSRLQAYYAHLRSGMQLDHTPVMRALLARILVAPAFLYRVESPPDQAGIVPLSNWGLASRLSFFLWSSVPDAGLRRAAEANELANPQQLARQARRMLRDPKARRLATEFFGQWFGFYRFDQHRGVDLQRFPEFTDSLKAAMYDEAVSFFEHIVREDRPVNEVLFADYAFLNRELANHYGVETAVALNDQVARVEGVSDFHRGGLLRLGAVLTVTSAPLRTSAVKRGDWILRRVLGTPVPPPPPDAGSIPADDVLSDGLTVRERLVAHRREASCVNCHSRFDPLGFALEHFDAVGRWRDNHRDGGAIDSTGVLNDGTEISGSDGLRQYLKRQRRQFHRTLCVKLLGYSLGRNEIASDRVLIEKMMAEIDKDGRFSNLIVQIVTSPQFRHQQGRDDARSRAARADPPREDGEHHGKQ